ncbi:MAG: Trk system potassium transporter TrkA [Victivallales bacterium]|nr:Trk system potassium transporter TrkA [Victivallales bacterium]
MKIIIIGAGELGQALARKLDSEDNDITIIDSSEDDFSLIHDKMDVMTVKGEAANVAVMKDAGIKGADLMIAVSGDQASNMLSCQIAKHFGVEQCICRVYSQDVFSAEDGFTPEFFGISNAFSSPAECVRHLKYVLQRQIIMEHIEFSNADATMVTVVIPENSPAKGVKLQDIPDKEMLENVRFAARIRSHKLVFPRGDTTLNEGDLVYVAGKQEYVTKFMDYVNGHAKEETHKLVIIGGANATSEQLAAELLDMGMEVRFVEPDMAAAEALLGKLPAGTRVVKGETTDSDALREAGIDGCDIFVSLIDDDETAILSGILAKREGAQKVVVVNHKPEYAGMIPAMGFIDCGLNSTVIAANAVFRMMDRGTIRIDTRLLAYKAHISEYKVQSDSNCVGKLLKDCKLPRESVLAMLFRDGSVMVPSGQTEFQAGDVVVAVLKSEADEQLRALF